MKFARLNFANFAPHQRQAADNMQVWCLIIAFTLFQFACSEYKYVKKPKIMHYARWQHATGITNLHNVKTAGLEGARRPDTD